MDRFTIAGLAGAVVVLVALWLFPSVLFPNPGANDAPILWNAPIPLVGLTLLACVAAVVYDRSKASSIATSTALGIFLIGVAVAFLIGLATFANLSNDRYWPFLLSPVVFAPAGLAVLVVGLAGRSINGIEVGRGIVLGGAATLFLIVWMLARGSRDWLLAPYGFDITLLIALEAAVVFLIGRRQRLPRQVGLS
ncbi:MAG TPA: hypothetical protein VFR33_15335 [Candidatus Dormibacteraeota bacterium]|nr:hypothetical protein [Candidatus Dormibacteraeota bacterium]